MTKIRQHHLEAVQKMRESGATWNQIYCVLAIGCEIDSLQKKYRKWRKENTNEKHERGHGYDY